ncbi:hypothetical protein JW859_04475 [bacterium]|nr:hypothetical protein [bacterium]
MPKRTNRRGPSAPGECAPLSHAQNFLTDPAVLRRLVGHVKPGGIETAVEIGPGRGALTTLLLRLFPCVLAVEADLALALALIERFGADPRITVVPADFLAFPLPARPYIVVANIPFNRTAEIVRKLAGESSGLSAAYLIMQREAALKFASAAGQPSLLAHCLALDFDVRLLGPVPRSAFTPRPGVDAAFALFRKRKVPVLAGAEAARFKDLLSYLHPRGPGLGAALRHVFTRAQVQQVLKAAGLDGNQPLSAVRLEHWLAIHAAFGEHATPSARRTVRGADARLAAQQERLEKRYRTSVSQRRK